MSFGVIVQYWRSFDQLEAYARNPDQLHWPVWVAFNRSVGESREDVGIWHETYRVKAGEYECIYSGMPPFGLAKASVANDAVGELDSAEVGWKEIETPTPANNRRFDAARAVNNTSKKRLQRTPTWASCRRR